MQSINSFTQVTFHYLNGETESFDIPVTPETFQEQLQYLYSQGWLTLHLFDRTVLIWAAQIVKIEVKPPLVELQGEGIFADVQRVTPLTHGAKDYD